MRRRECGLTLAEMAVTLAVAGMMLAAALGILSLTVRRWGLQATRSLAIQQATVAVERMAQDIRSAIAFTTTTSGSNVLYTFSLPGTRGADGDYVPVRSGATLAYGVGDQVRFYVSDATGSPSTVGSALWRAVLPAGQSTWAPDQAWSLTPGTTAPRCDKATYFRITSAGTNVVQISLTVRVTEGRVASDYNLVRKVLLSNHN